MAEGRPATPVALWLAVAVPPLALAVAFLWYVYSPGRVEDMMLGLAREAVGPTGDPQGVDVVCRYAGGFELRNARAAYVCEISGICEATVVRRDAYVDLDRGPHIEGAALDRTIAESCPASR